MKWFGCLVVLVTLAGCCRDDCWNGPTFRFRLLDENGKNIVFDLGVSVDSLQLLAPGQTAKEYLDIDYADSSLVTSLSASATATYTVKYKGQTTDLTLNVQKTGKDRCCGVYYGITEVSSNKGKATTDLTKLYGDTIFVITL